MPGHRLQTLLEPRSIAMVGASPRPASFGWRSYRAPVDGGYEGDIHLVNPRYETIDGRVCADSLRDLKGVEHAVLNVSNTLLEGVLDDAIAAGIPAVTIFASGYLEGDHDPPLLERLRTKTRAAKINVCGGNGTGFKNRDHKVQCTLVSHPEDVAGEIAWIAQSGSVYGSLIETDGRIRFNLSVSSGQEIATSAADYMDYALELPTTRAIALSIETIRDPDGFVAAAQTARDRGIRVVALKVARTEASAKMALSHSGALAGNDDVYNAVFERAGVTRAHDFDELIATLQLAIQPRVMVPGGIVAIADSGGEREHLADLADAENVRFADISSQTRAKLAERLEYGLDPVNPLDAWGTGNNFLEIFSGCFQALVEDEDAGIGVWVADMRDEEEFRRPYEAPARAIAESTGKPVVFANTVPNGVVHETANRLREAGTPLLDGLGPAIKAVSNAMIWRDDDARSPMQPPAPPAGNVVTSWRERLGDREPLDEAEGLALLREFGIATVEAKVVGDANAARDAATSLGWPVVLKTAMPGIAHKSDVEGVVLGIESEAQLLSAYATLSEKLGSRCLVESMAAPGVEMVFGLTTDPQFGPVVLVGAGGILVEVMGDVSYAIPPFDTPEARRLLDRLRARALLDGVRGGTAADVDALAQSLARFSVLASTLGDVISEMDVNPIIAGPSSALAADVLIMSARTSASISPDG